MKVVIIGGGGFGSAAAYFLTSHPRFAGTITVIERDPSYRHASSALSASGIRQQFSTALNIDLSLYGVEFMRHAAATLAVDGDAPLLPLREAGYLFLASPAGVEVLRQNHAVQQARGANIVLLDPAALAARFPWLATEGVAEGAFGLTGEGWFDGPALLAAFRRKARALGVTYLATEAVGCRRAGDKVAAVRLADGTELPCDVAVNAAGAWSARVAAFAGIDLPVRARRRVIYVLACREKLPGCPLVVDPTGIWFRPEGDVFLTSRSPDADEPDPDEPPLTTEEDNFEDHIWPVLAGRVPAFEAVRVVSSWAGYYEMNLFDQNGVVGPHPAVPNLIFAAGFSGHGMQHIPAVGRGLAELIAEGGYTTLDLAPLGFARLLEDRPMIEKNIV